MLLLRPVRLSNSPRRGFTLVEIAIVLGIIGTIVAAIFAASAASNRGIKANKITDQLSVIVDNVRSYYASQGYPVPAACSSVFPGTVMSISTGVFPPDVIDLAQREEVKVALCTDTTTSAAQIVVRYTSVPQNYCHNVVIAASSPALGMKLNKVIAGTKTFSMPAPGKTTLSLGVDAASGAIIPSDTLDAACADPLTTIDWYYNLTN